jgi:hypothetical protein
MPIHKVGKTGFRYGTHGKLYHGRNAYYLALRQAMAIHASQARSGRRRTRK